MIEIQSRDYWFKIVDFLQQNWALIDKIDDTKVTVFFLNDLSGVFDSIDFASMADAEAGLLANGFKRLADDSKAQQMLAEPHPPFIKRNHPNGKIYSSGRYWK
jgi:hypothetical protein